MEAEASRSWSCSANWTVAEGTSLEGSISFETSEEDAPALTSNGSVLNIPESDEPPPCEVTVFLSQKHEIHRIYARTTARTFEVYYTKDTQSNTKEYLCTVKCGPALPAVNSSVHSSEEETWVEVKPPESSSTTDHSTEIQMHYEATAEISDADPCASLTLRFLSLQTKSSVHIEEIYILADPLDESITSQNPSVGTAGNFNASSMFAMLVPNLLQMSKSGRSNRINNQYFSTDRIRNTEKIEGQTVKFRNQVTEKFTKQNSNPIEKNDDIKQVDQKICINTETSNIKQVDEEVYVSTETPKAGPTSHVEKLLEQLVSKVDKIETYFIKFEEKMVGPISTIETRLFQLENQFNQFSKDLLSLKVESNERNQDDRALRDNSVANSVAGHSRPGFRAPDFISDDDDDESDHDGTLNHDINVATSMINKRKPISIDGALASALAAFASDSKSKLDPTVDIDRSNEIDDLDFGDQTGRVGESSEGVPLVSIDEVKVEAGSDPFVSFEKIPHELDQNLGQSSGFEKEMNELDHNLGQLDGFGKEMNELVQNLGQLDGFEQEMNELEQNLGQLNGFEKEMNELDQNLGQIDGDLVTEVGHAEETIQGSDNEIKNDKGVFYTSSDEEDLDFEPDLFRFKSNSPLSESGFGSNFPTYNNKNNCSSDSSFDETFLHSRVQIDLSDNSCMESGNIYKSTLKNSEIGADLGFAESSSFVPLVDLLSGISENISRSNGPLIDLEEDLPNSSETCQKDGNIEQFESLI